MIRQILWLSMFVLSAFASASCTMALWSKPDIVIEQASVKPGESVTKKGTAIKLMGTPLHEGGAFTLTGLTDSATMKPVDLSELKGAVLFVSVVPSIDTKVCEEQTHYLGEEGDRLSPGITRITVSRDTPFAQNRFAEEAKLTDIRYLSDYKQGDFGRATGLLMDGPMLLARSVILVDKEGVVRYIQVVPEITHLPDMEAAFSRAEELLKEK